MADETNRRDDASCPDCGPASAAAAGRGGLPSRRDVLRRAAGGVVAASAASAGLFDVFGRPTAAWAADVAGEAGKSAAAASSSETLVAQLYKSLDDKQRKALCFPFEHELRSKVDNNWFIVKQSIGDILNKDQQALVKDIFMGLHSPEYAQRVYDQVEHDGGGAGTFHECAVALFGEPGETGDGGRSRFEFVLTGRHCTRRCDGNSVAGAAFGGPIFYGHAAKSFNEPADHPGNAYWFQAVRANEVFKALDGKQRNLALRSDARSEQGTKTVALKGTTTGLAGIPMTELAADQKDLVRKTLADLLALFRKADADEAMRLIEAAGFDHLHMAFYKNMDIGNDGVWDVWQIEGPQMVWYFRGKPHVHTWVHIREPGVG